MHSSTLQSSKSAPYPADLRTDPVRLAVIGAGYWGPNVIRNVTAHPATELVAVCDLDLGRLERVGVQYPATRTTQDLSSVLADDSIDGIALATPAETHAAIAIDALRAGKHVLVEKPLALTVDEAESMVVAAKKAERILMVGHTFEYNAAVRQLRGLVESGELGDVYYLYSQRVNLGRVRTDCNAMWNLAPHDVSICNYLVGEAPIWTSATGFNFLPGNSHEDVVFLSIGYPDNRVAHVHVSWLDPSKVRRTTVVGSKKMVVYDDMSTEAKLKIFDKGIDKIPDPNKTLHAQAPSFQEFQFLTRTGDILIPKIDFNEPLREEIGHFAECIATGQQPRTDGINGLNVVKVLNGAQQSLENGGQRIEL